MDELRAAKVTEDDWVRRGPPRALDTLRLVNQLLARMGDERQDSAR